MERHVWDRDVNHGITLLSRHCPKDALRHFKQALKLCPVRNRVELDEILYFVGISLKKLGLCGSAVKSWNAGRKIIKNGLAARMYSRFANSYGMVKQATPDLDDWNAFYSIQLQRYLESKRSRKLGTEGEHDMIWDLIYEHWVNLKHSGAIDGLSPCEKISVFVSEKIVFPYFRVPEDAGNTVLTVDFSNKSKVKPDDPCPCRSGSSYIECCGRTKSEEEIFYGVF